MLFLLEELHGGGKGGFRFQSIQRLSVLYGTVIGQLFVSISRRCNRNQVTHSMEIILFDIVEIEFQRKSAKYFALE